MWGIGAIESSKDFEHKSIICSSIKIPRLLEKCMNRTFFRGSSGIRVELSALSVSHRADLIYSVCGPLSLTGLYPKAKVIPWVFRPPSFPVRNPINAYSPPNLKKNIGFMCLTPKAETYYSKFSFSKFIPWSVDTQLFDGKPSSRNNSKPFFLATGKTGRDYDTLVSSAVGLKANIRIIGPASQKPNQTPCNVEWIETSSDPPDQAIDYLTLREWYRDCLAVCIPLSGDSEDTCGYTNMLEGMAMRKPILMTRSGSLDLEPEKQGFGKFIQPKDKDEWTQAMNGMVAKPLSITSMGENGRKIVESEFTVEKLNQNILDFIEETYSKQ